MKNSGFRYLIRPRYLELIKRIAIGNEKNQSQLARKIGRTKNQTSHVLNYWEEMGIVELDREGRSTSASLTEEGRKIANNLIKCSKIMEKCQK